MIYTSGPSVPAADLKSTKANLLAEWHRRIKRLPPAARFAWLENASGLVAFGARQRRHLTKQLEAIRRQFEESVPGGAWLDAGWEQGEKFPPPGMVVARHPVRLGEGPPRRRQTPPVAVVLEDELDGLSYSEAAFYHRPPSVSAMMIRRIGHLKGREIDPITVDEDAGSIERLKCRKRKLAAALLKGKERRAATSCTRHLSLLEIFDSVKDSSTKERI